MHKLALWYFRHGQGSYIVSRVRAHENKLYLLQLVQRAHTQLTVVDNDT